MKFRPKPTAHGVAGTNGLAPSFSLRRSQHTSSEACRDEHFPAGILTPGIKPRSCLPALSRSGLLELVARHSGATVPDSHRVP